MVRTSTRGTSKRQRCSLSSSPAVAPLAEGAGCVGSPSAAPAHVFSVVPRRLVVFGEELRREQARQ